MISFKYRSHSLSFNVKSDNLSVKDNKRKNKTKIKMVCKKVSKIMANGYGPCVCRRNVQRGKVREHFGANFVPLQ